MKYMPFVWLFLVSLSVPRGSGSFKQEKHSNVSIEHVASHQYLRGLCSQKSIYTSPNPGLSFRATCSNMELTNHRNHLNDINHRWGFFSLFIIAQKIWSIGGIDFWNSLFFYFVFSEKITIYSYKSSGWDRFSREMPVVLNFTESNCFLRCCKEGERVLLQVEVITITECVSPCTHS